MYRIDRMNWYVCLQGRQKRRRLEEETVQDVAEEEAVAVEVCLDMYLMCVMFWLSVDSLTTSVVTETVDYRGTEDNSRFPDQKYIIKDH